MTKKILDSLSKIFPIVAFLVSCSIEGAGNIEQSGGVYKFDHVPEVLLIEQGACHADTVCKFALVNSDDHSEIYYTGSAIGKSPKISNKSTLGKKYSNEKYCDFIRDNISYYVEFTEARVQISETIDRQIDPNCNLEESFYGITHLQLIERRVQVQIVPHNVFNKQDVVSFKKN